MYRFLVVFIAFFQLGVFGQSHVWQRTNPGGGGAIATVVATPDGTILVASDLSGIYRSTDNGLSWDVVGANNSLIETHISSFGLDWNHPETFFAGTYIGVYKTVDGGESFNFVFPGVNNDFDYSYIEDIAMAPSDSNIGYLTHHPGPDSDGTIYKTVDAGETWNSIPNNDLPGNLHLIKLMVHPLNPDMVFVLTGKSRWGCSEANLYRSNDGGVHWQEIGADKGDILDMDLHPTNTDIVYFSTFGSNYTDNNSCKGLSMDEYLSGDETEGALYKVTNAGTNYTLISDKTGIISVDYTNPDTIKLFDFLYPYSWNDEAGVWETTDSGTTWTHTGLMTNWMYGYTDNEYYTYSMSFNGLNKTVSRDLFNSNNFYGSFGQWAWASFDGGVHFNNVSTRKISENHWLSTGVENINGHGIQVNKTNPDVVYIGGWDIGFWYTTDHGASWSRTQPDYNIYPEYSWDLGVPGTVDENEAKRGAGANVMTLCNDPDRPEVVWASFSREQFTDPNENSIAKTGLFKSENYGEDWELITEGLPGFDTSIRMYGLSIDRNSAVNNRTLFITVDGKIYRSTDDGNTWSLVFQGASVKFTEVDKTDSSIVYAGGKDGLWKSVNHGLDWVEIGLPEMHHTHANIRPDIVPTWIFESNGSYIYPWEGVFDICTDPNVPGSVYVSVLGPDKGLYHSSDGGLTWNHIITDSDMRGVAVAPENSNIVYATSSKSYHSGGFGNSKGVLYSEDAGETWQEVNQGMAFNYAGMIEVETGARPYVWTWSPGTGVQRAKVPYFDNLSSQDSKFESDIHVYPNPVDDTLYFSVVFQKASYRIVSSQGSIVKEGNLSDSHMDISSLNPGVYYLRIKDMQNSKTYSFPIVKK